jgi:hypothetical protein
MIYHFEVYVSILDLDEILTVGCGVSAEIRAASPSTKFHRVDPLVELLRVRNQYYSTPSSDSKP